MPGENLEGKPGNIAFREGKRGLYWVWWLIGAVVQILVCLPWVIKQIHWKALGITIFIFVIIMFVSESIALYWGWWVWNEAKLLGPKVGLIPLEEFLLYFAVVPSVVVIQLLIAKWQSAWRK